MDAILTGYEVSQTAWLYLSSMLIIAVFYRFRRPLSLRNFDLILLLSLSPGVLMVRSHQGASAGYTFLFLSTALWTIRLLWDRYLTKRPRIDPNLISPGMIFLGVCAFAFLMTESITRPADPSTVTTVMKGEKIIQAASSPGNADPAVIPDKPSEKDSDPEEAGPTASLLGGTVSTISRLFSGYSISNDSSIRFGIVEETAARILAILAHIAIITGLYWIGRNHFHDKTQGVAMATIYLLMPCTSYVVSEVDQVLPCAFIIWAIASYTRPIIAGVLMGFACGSMFFPIFLLPIWISFFGWKRSLPFFAGIAIVAAILAGAIALITPDTYTFTQQTINRIDFRLLSFEGGSGEQGFWNSIHPAYRIPVMVAFAILVITLTVWPWKKTLEVLLSYNAAIIVFTQFWYPQLGGVYVLWYLPLLILVIFRPRLLAQCVYPAVQSHRATQLEPGSSSAGAQGIGTVSHPFYR